MLKLIKNFKKKNPRTYKVVKNIVKYGSIGAGVFLSGYLGTKMALKDTQTSSIFIFTTMGKEKETED